MFTHVEATVSLPAVASPRRKTRTRTRRQAATQRCLVVSADPKRREMLAGFAAQGGWDAEGCPSAEEGWLLAGQADFGLCLVDLQDTDDIQSAALREVSEHLQHRQAMVVVCGNMGDPREELWARQMGAWMYLPGVSEGCTVASICETAAEVIERRRVTNHSGSWTR